jgi:hypothetical protein
VDPKKDQREFQVEQTQNLNLLNQFLAVEKKVQREFQIETKITFHPESRTVKFTTFFYFC